MSKILASVDLGGTTAKLAFFTYEGDLITKWEIKTDISRNGENIVKNIAFSLKEKMKEFDYSHSNVLGIGMGAPGFIDYEKGEIALAPNLGWKDHPLKKELEKETGLPVIIENDANMAAIGEMWLGAGKGTRNMLAVTLGTGVGGGIIANGEIIRGVNGMGGEIGHIMIDEKGPLCGCGRKGCLETYASATGISRIAKEYIESYHDNRSFLCSIYDKKGYVTAQEVFDFYKKGDFIAKDIVEISMKPLAFSLSNLVHTLNPELIVIGGGVSKAGEPLLSVLDVHLKRFMLPRAYSALSLKIATLGNDAGIIGGAYLVKKTSM